MNRKVQTAFVSGLHPQIGEMSRNLCLKKQARFLLDTIRIVANSVVVGSYQISILQRQRREIKEITL